MSHTAPTYVVTHVHGPVEYADTFDAARDLVAAIYADDDFEIEGDPEDFAANVTVRHGSPGRVVAQIKAVF